MSHTLCRHFCMHKLPSTNCVSLSPLHLKRKRKKKAGNKWSNILPKVLGVPYDNMLHIPPTIFFLLAAKQKPYKKAYLLTKNIETFSGKKSKECAVLIDSWLSYIMQLCLDHAILTIDYHKANQYINQQLTHLNQ